MGGLGVGAHACAGIDRFIGPEGPADIVLLERAPERAYPIVGIFTRFAKKYRYILVLGELDLWRKNVFRRLRPIDVKRKDELRIETHIAEHVEIITPLRAGKEQQVIAIDLPDRCGDLLVQRFELGIEAAIGLVARYWLVQEVVTDHVRVRGVMAGHPGPELPRPAPARPARGARGDDVSNCAILT